MENYQPPKHDLIRIIHHNDKAKIIVGKVGVATFDLTPQQAISLGLVMMETGLHENQKVRKNIAMQTTTVEERINNLVAKHLGCDAHKVHSDALLGNDLGADSMDHIELAMAIEEELGVSMNDDEALKTTTVQDLYDLVKKKLG